MLFQKSTIAFPVTRKPNVDVALIARQDRLPIWSLPKLSLAIIGIGFLFIFFDIGDINVSFIQTCTQIVPGCLPQTAGSSIGLPVLFNLVGYVLGALVLSPFADRFGRRDMMVITMMITGLGSLFTAFVSTYTMFILARAITGIGVGADLAMVNTYINEVSPNRGRAKYTALIFLLSTVGFSVSIWLGLYLTTPATPFPFGLPIALASDVFPFGWRIMYWIGASLAVVGLLLRFFALPESPRWLISRGRLAEAERIVSGMEQRARNHLGELPLVAPELPVHTIAHSTGYGEIVRNTVYVKRTILLLVIWFLGYITVYSTAAGLTVLLAALGYPAPEAGLITAIGILGDLICAFIAYAFGERLERKFWLLIAALVTLVGGITIALSGSTFGVTVLGSIMLNAGAYLWIPMTYTWSTENYPTRARASGFALVDGVGHIGGGVGVIYVTTLAAKLGPLETFVLLGSFLLVAAWLALFGPATRHKRLDEVSP